ncbi:MAG: hypothetical protein IK105_09290 [Thermoguttaceae bacterium]|nr:hypothetical protein [Thermoguttaceae bacterium]
MSVFPNAKKNGVGDIHLCWAAVASNALTAAGYAQEAGFLDDANSNAEDKVFEYFKEHFPDDGGSIYLGVKWFLTGKFQILAKENPFYSRPIKDGGGFFRDLLLQNRIRLMPSTSLRFCKEYLTSGYGACALSINIYDDSLTVVGSHALSLYNTGHTENDSRTYEANDPRYYNYAVYCDPDTINEATKYRSLFYHPSYRTYRFRDRPWEIKNILFLDKLDLS